MSFSAIVIRLKELLAGKPKKERLVGYVKPGTKGRWRAFVDSLDGDHISMSNPRGRSNRDDAVKLLERLRDGDIEIRYD